MEHGALAAGSNTAQAASLAVTPAQGHGICLMCAAAYDVVRTRMLGMGTGTAGRSITRRATGRVADASVAAAAGTTTTAAVVAGAAQGATAIDRGTSTTVSSKSGTSSKAGFSGVASSTIVKVNCGLLGGVSQAGLFNPWDRALYLSVKHNRPFLAPANFSRPYQGFLQAIVQRTLSTGLYFPLEDLFMMPCEKMFGKGSYTAAFFAGNLAGAINGVVLNPASAVKYHTWGQESASFGRTAQMMWREGGIQPFLKGTHPTILRDLTFGGVYSLIRNRLLGFLESQGLPRTSTEAFVVNMLAAGVATTVSGPFNYVRNIQYSFPADMAPPTTGTILKDLYQEAMTQKDYVARMELVQNRLRIGWGTTRVAVGMAFTHQVYEMCKSKGKRAGQPDV